MLYPFLALIATIGTTAILCSSARFWGHQILGPILAGSVVTSIFIAGKLGTLELPGFAPLAITVSILIYSSTFLITDVLSELAGAKAAQRAVLGTALCYPLVLLTSQLSVNWTPSPLFEGQVAFEEVMTFAGRVTIASLVSYLISQTFDVWAFHAIKARTGEAKLWLRNNGSTMVSQGIDTLIFYGIAFFGVIPFEALIQLTLLGYGLKMVIALIDTPFVYAVIWFVKRGQQTSNG
jgi:uncharacterized integral membrane protein (TIGR00697 family)